MSKGKESEGMSITKLIAFGRMKIDPQVPSEMDISEGAKELHLSKYDKLGWDCEHPVDKQHLKAYVTGGTCVECTVCGYLVFNPDELVYTEDANNES